MPLPHDEIVQIVDRDNRPLATCPRSVMRTQRHIHRASYILVFNSRHELYVQKRTITKDIYPGYWDVAAGGVVLAGESYAASAARELREELGVTGVLLEVLFDRYFEDRQNRVWGRIFTCTHDGPFTLQAEEIDSGRFMTPREALDLSRREPFTPDGLEILHHLGAAPWSAASPSTFFLHGLDSSSRGTKGQYFHRHFPHILAPDFSGSLRERMHALETICRGREHLVLIGSSFGGLMATCFAIAHPDRVRKLILLAPALNFSEFSAPIEPLSIPTRVIIGKDDTVTPPDLVLPLVRATFLAPDIHLCDDDHLLRSTFPAMDWKTLLN